MNNPTVSMPKLLGLSEVSEMLDVPVATLRYWRHLTTKKGKPTGPKSAAIGNSIRYREADVIAWVQARFDGDSNE